MKIAILGAGVFGTALGGVLADNGYDIDYYDINFEKERLAGVVKSAEYILLCIPSESVPYVLPHLPTDLSLIVATKGILTDKIFDRFDDWMVLSGPGYAADIKQNKPTHLTATDERAVQLFATDYLDFDQTTDKKGVLMCGALKNVYALGAGLKNLQSGTEPYEQYLANAADEMRALLLVNGANPETVDLNCGMADLRLTCSPSSRNYRYGQALRKSKKTSPSETIEGLTTLRRLKRGEIVLLNNLKILEGISDEIK